MKREFLRIHNLVTGEEEGGLSRFHLRLSCGDFVEMLGTEGAGKSAAASFFSGKEKIREGYVRIAGVRYYPGETLSGADIQCIGPVPSLAESLTVAENVALLTPKRRIRGLIRHKDMEARVNFLLAEFGLTIRADRKVQELSESEKRCVELVRAAENEVPFIFLSHVFDSLGQADIQLIEECLLELKKRGTTILILGGGFPIFRGLDDRIVVLRGGQTVRTIYSGSFDREEYVKWVFGVTIPENVRQEATVHLQNRKTDRYRETDRHGEGGRDEVLRLGSVRFGASEEISMSVMRGEIVGLYDMNNICNRELIRLLTGGMEPDSGWMSLMGRPYAPASLREAIRRGVSFIPGTVLQNAVIEGMSCGENLALSTLRQHSLLGIFPKKRVLKFLEREFLPETGDGTGADGAGGLSRYDKMRIVLGRALISRPVLLLAEDIASDMSVGMLKLENEYFSRLTREGCAVLISSQNFTVLRQICDRILVINSNQEASGFRP